MYCCYSVSTYILSLCVCVSPAVTAFISLSVAFTIRSENPENSVTSARVFVCQREKVKRETDMFILDVSSPPGGVVAVIGCFQVERYSKLIFSQ